MGEGFCIGVAWDGRFEHAAMYKAQKIVEDNAVSFGKRDIFTQAIIPGNVIGDYIPALRIRGVTPCSVRRDPQPIRSAVTKLQEIKPEPSTICRDR
jgi:hypothetical protein